MLTGFAYLVDQDETVCLSKSSQTYGARFAGAHPLTKAVKLSYAASYARQSDYRNNPNDYSAEYYLVEAGLGFSGFTIGGGYEVLGADNGVALTSFQTPLATLHKVQGWADKVLATPDRKSVVGGKSVSVRVDLGGSRIIQKQQNSTCREHSSLSCT